MKKIKAKTTTMSGLTTTRPHTYRHIHILGDAPNNGHRMTKRKRSRQALTSPGTIGIVCEGYRDFSSVSVEDTIRLAAAAISPGVDDVTAEPSLKHGSFPMRLHAILSNKAAGQAASWKPHGRCFQITVPKMAEKICDSLLGIRRYQDFLNILSLWGFKQVRSGSDRLAYYHEAFLFGMPHLTGFMEKAKAIKRASKSLQAPNFGELHISSPLARLPSRELNLKRKVVGTENLEVKRIDPSTNQAEKNQSPIIAISGDMVVDTDEEHKIKDTAHHPVASQRGADYNACGACAHSLGKESYDEGEQFVSGKDFGCTLSMSSRLSRFCQPLSLEDTVQLVSHHIQNLVTSFVSPATDRRYQVSDQDKKRRQHMAKLLQEFLCVEALSLDTSGDALALIDKLNKTARNICLQYYNMNLDAEKVSPPPIREVLRIKHKGRSKRNVRWDEYQRVRVYDPSTWT
jgi:hypothetical protein